MRPTIILRSKEGSSFGAQARAQTHVFSMIAGEVQANSNIVTSTMLVFGTSARVLFDSGSSRSFVSSSFALHVNRELSLLKHKLVITTFLGEQIL